MPRTDSTVWVLLLVGAVILCVAWASAKSEGYRDPIYPNRAKMALDYYPRANGSIYGFPYGMGGSWSIFSGWPLYPKAY